MDENCLNLLKGLLDKNPRRRLKAEEALEDPWIKKDNDICLDNSQFSDIYSSTPRENKRGISPISV